MVFGGHGVSFLCVQLDKASWRDFMVRQGQQADFRVLLVLMARLHLSKATVEGFSMFRWSSWLGFAFKQGQIVEGILLQG